MTRLLFLLFLTSRIVYAQTPLTVFEKSGGRSTSTYKEAIRFYQEIDDLYDVAALVEMGSTDSGEPLHLLLISSDGVTRPEDVRRQNKLVLLINNGIHPGEPDGIEASMMFARNLLSGPGQKILENVIVGIIPVYNIGGALNRNSASRVNQNGPEEYGFRGNARNYDLNRDFIKADSRNAVAFQQIFQLLDPDVFIDTHVSNGADYQYTITHVATQGDKLGGTIGKFMYDTIIPEMEARMNSHNWKITPYVNVFNRPPDPEGFRQFQDSPRYSTGYAALFHTIGFMVEPHMLKPFEDRVNATYVFLETLAEMSAAYAGKIRNLRQESREITPGNNHVIDWKLNPEEFRKIEFDGYEAAYVKSEISGKDRLYYDRQKPFTRSIDYFDSYIPAKEVVVPRAYIIPKGWHHIISRLEANGVPLKPLAQDSTITVESYHIESFETSRRPYEGHYPHSQVTISTHVGERTFFAGDVIIEVTGKTARFVIEVLEPEAADSYFRWNLFDTILQQKEGFSPYVFEDLAANMLKEDPGLREMLINRQQTDSTFAASGYAQLNFIYENSESHESAYRRYPVYRMMD